MGLLISKEAMPLYTVISKELFKAVRANAGIRKGRYDLRISSSDRTVALNIKDRYYAQQFGTLEQARNKFRELKQRIRND